MKYKLGSVSVQGSYHNINQDYALVKQINEGCAIALADGLGSCSLSQYGAKNFCECVIDLSEKYNCNIDDNNEFLTELHKTWLSRLDEQKLPVTECYCTALFVIIYRGKYKAFHLGDGIVCVMTDDECVTLLENKTDFANFTEPLREKLELAKWQIHERCYKKMQGVFLSSDGLDLVDNDEKTVTNFVTDFLIAYNTMDIGEIEKDVTEWLTTWPSPDDKTIAFLMRKEPYNGECNGK